MQPVNSPTTLIRAELDPRKLDLPACAIPRPGDQVVWFQNGMPMSGQLLGHNLNGRPVVVSRFGAPLTLLSFDSVRRNLDVEAVGPTWSRMAATGRILKPNEDEADLLRNLLNRRTPPGPKYIDLIYEIWARGFEIFVVGGTVRDAVGGHEPADVDLITTMPLVRLIDLTQDMYRTSSKISASAKKNGHLRLGGDPSKGDPTLDLSVFKASLPGSTNVLFGSDIEVDCSHRDFGCNSVYYDPINEALIDPSGHGIKDAEHSLLDLVCRCEVRTPHQIGQIACRYFKFVSRGFVGSTDCRDRMREEIVSYIGSMGASEIVRYVRAQVVSKHAPADRQVALEAYGAAFNQEGFGSIWTEHIFRHSEEILA